MKATSLLDSRTFSVQMTDSLMVTQQSHDSCGQECLLNANVGKKNGKISTMASHHIGDG